MSIFSEHAKKQESDFYLRTTSYLMHIKPADFREELTRLYNSKESHLMAVATILNAIYTEGKPTFFISRRTFEALIVADKKNLNYKSRPGIPSGNPMRATFIKVMQLFREFSQFEVYTESCSEKKTPACVGLIDEVMLRSMGDQMAIKLASNWHQMAIKTIELLEITKEEGKRLPDSDTDSYPSTEGEGESDRKNKNPVPPDDDPCGQQHKKVDPLTNSPGPQKVTNGPTSVPIGKIGLESPAGQNNGIHKAQPAPSILDETGPIESGVCSQSAVSRKSLSTILSAYPTTTDFNERFEDMATCCQEMKRSGYTRDQVLAHSEAIVKKWLGATKYKSKATEATGKKLISNDLTMAIAEVFPSERFQELSHEEKEMLWLERAIKSGKIQHN